MDRLSECPLETWRDAVPRCRAAGLVVPFWALGWEVMPW